MTSSQKQVRNTNSIVMIDHDSPYWYCSWHLLERFSSTLNEGLRCATDSGTAREPFTRLRITQYHLVLVNAFKPSREEKPMQRPASAGLPPQFSFSYITTIGPPLSEIFLLPRRCLACPVQEPETYGVEFSWKMIEALSRTPGQLGLRRVTMRAAPESGATQLSASKTFQVVIETD